MFNWFKNFKNSKDENPNYGYTNMENTINPIPPIPNIPKNQFRDHYRVGYDNETGATTLTLHTDVTSMTLSLGPLDVLRLIRMLGATLDDDVLDHGNEIDDDYDE
jgi:hypothetical protein